VRAQILFVISVTTQSESPHIFPIVSALVCLPITSEKNDLDECPAAGIYYGVGHRFRSSMYRTRIADPNLADSANFPECEGVPARQRHDIRSEFGPIFSFQEEGWRGEVRTPPPKGGGSDLLPKSRKRE
jgi:hypothetical protein